MNKNRAHALGHTIFNSYFKFALMVIFIMVLFNCQKVNAVYANESDEEIFEVEGTETEEGINDISLNNSTEINEIDDENNEKPDLEDESNLDTEPDVENDIDNKDKANLEDGGTTKNIDVIGDDTNEDIEIIGSINVLNEVSTESMTEKIVSASELIYTKSTLVAAASTTPQVARLYGSNRYQTAIDIAKELKDELGVSKFENVIIATGEGYPDALSGAYLSKVKNAPILLVNVHSADSVASYVKSNLMSSGTVYILGSTGAISSSIASKFNSYNTVRLGGSNRYETNLKILEEAGVKDVKDIMVCSGNSYPDALSAAATGKPILIVNTALTNNQKSFLSSRNRTFYVIGGTSAVRESVADELKNYGSVKRVYGANRYETSVEVANYFFPSNQKKVVVATGLDFPDALAGGAFAIRISAPILLAANNNLAYAYNYAYDSGAQKIYLLGGSASLNAKAAGNTLNVGSFTLSGCTYIIKSNGRMAQYEWTTMNGIKYRASAGGPVIRSSEGAKLGIDVSQFNGTINWGKVAAAGIEFAFVRVGGRFASSGYIYEDTKARENIAGAINVGIKTGVYFFTQAITEEEAIAEAKYTLNYIHGFNITMPIVIDTESFSGGRHNNISAAQRTKVVKAFMDYVQSQGYKPMLYAGQYWIRDNLVASELTKYDLWMPQYNSVCTYAGDYVCWQYTSSGKVDGINGNVDMNWWYGRL